MQPDKKTVREIDIVVNLYNIGDSTNDISYTYEDCSITYIKNSNIKTGHIVKLLDSYSCESVLRKELSLHFNLDTVERIMYGVHLEVDNKLSKNALDENILFVEVYL